KNKVGARHSIRCLADEIRCSALEYPAFSGIARDFLGQLKQLMDHPAISCDQAAGESETFQICVEFGIVPPIEHGPFKAIAGKNEPGDEADDVEPGIVPECRVSRSY